MIIAKELIDASINAKNAAKEAHDNAMLEAIKKKLPELKPLPGIIKDIMDTYRYVRRMDEEASKLMWTEMCRGGEQFGLDFFNALTVAGTNYCGVNPHYTVKGVNSHIFVTEIGIFCGEYDNLHTIGELTEHTKPEGYECTYKSLCLLVDSVPKYRDYLENKLNEILK